MTKTYLPPVTGQRPAEVTEEDARQLKERALQVLQRARTNRTKYLTGWRTAQQIGVPSWVLGELYADGKVRGKKTDHRSPNLWGI